MINENSGSPVEGSELTMGPDGITLDKAGRITFVEADILETIVAAGSLRLVDDTNYFQCGNPNNYQCGKVSSSTR